MPKRIAAGEVPALLSPGLRVFVQATAGEPLALVEALKAAPEASRGVRYLACPLPGFNTVDYAALASPTLFLTIILMAIGAGPCSTVGAAPAPRTMRYIDAGSARTITATSSL